MLKIKVKIGAVVAVVAVAVTVVALAVPGAASANAGNCRAGLNTATVGWGYCDYVGGLHSSAFRVVAECWYYPASINYGAGGSGRAVYVWCPSWSHITRIWAEPFYG
jgi:hypothetical protein